MIALLLALAPAAGGCPAQFVDVASQVGLAFTHDRGTTREHHMAETMGSGLAWLDYDNDGWMDLYVVQSGPFPPSGSPRAQDRLFRNSGDGTFTDVTARAKLHDGAYGLGAYAADFDADGWVDLLVTNWGGVILYRNKGDGTFTDVTAESGLQGVKGFVTAAAWGDVDGDGRLDLFLARYVDDRNENKLFCGDPATGKRAYCYPMMYPGTSPLLFANAGGGGFQDITGRAGLGAAVGRGLGAVFVDVDLDGKLDLYVANDETTNFLFHNLGGGRFEDVSVVSGTGFDAQGNPQGGMGVDAGDLDGDGLPDLVVANFEGETNEYYRNLGSDVFEDLSLSSGFGPPAVNFVGFGLNLLDVDNDGDLDAFIANGHTFERPTRQGSTYAEKAFLMWNDGTGHFRERACGPGFSPEYVGRGSAVADYDNDGDPDVAVSNSGGPLQLLRNDGGGGHWVGVQLVGRKSNRQGIGSRLVAETPTGRKLTRFVQAGNSYLSSSDPRVVFGLGSEEAIRKLTVYWPSGIVQVLEDLPSGGYRKVEEKAEPASAVRPRMPR
ncbi:MAG: CRTAC1 family protein [Acidobacteriota bacterium]